jgi:sulfite exporter TauE/SafE
LGYNAGRILSYAFQGLLIGFLGAGMLLAGQAARSALLAFASCMLIATGLYLMGEQRILGVFERAGAPAWRRIQGLSSRFLPAKDIWQALPLGFLWGFLPCGLVYNALASALSSGSPAKGALILLAFGLGTLPNLLLAGFFLARFRAIWQKRATRIVVGLILIAYGTTGLWDAFRLA